MHHKATLGPAEEDHVYEQAVLTHVLFSQPTILRLCDLKREVRPGIGNSDPADAVERAVRELVKVNLLHRHGDCVLPTSTAVYVSEMDLG
ncbi:MAG TPA: hypothetical protein VFN85_01990 [Solirubrobacterales bacterium]|nr:hypothetical protein [Solirubrobacterales bacterium]